jgi:hypothetical protein
LVKIEEKGAKKRRRGMQYSITPLLPLLKY